MPWTKKQFINQALEEIGIASYIFEMQPDKLQSAARVLDAMMATWNNQGLRLSYPIASNPDDIDLDQETGVPDAANLAIFKKLAIEIADSFGKVVSSRLETSAKNAYDSLLARAIDGNIKQLPAGVPLGAGNKGYRTGRIFTGEPCEDLPID